MIKKILTVILLISVSLKVFSQAGTGVYKFLDLPVSSRLAALGGSNVSLRDNDLSFAFINPALLTTETDNMISISAANYLADITYGSASYGKNFGKNFFGVGLQYVNYGKFTEYTDIDQATGSTFTAQDMALHMIYARPLNEKITVGGTFKPIYSVYEQYKSFGVAADLGINFYDPKSSFAAGLVLRNIGTQLKAYYADQDGQHYEPLAFNILAGISYKLSHAPLRFSLTLHDLQQWNLYYSSTNQPISSSTFGTDNSSNKKNPSFVDMAFRHTIFAVEFVPSKSFYVTAAYNHRRQTEMSINNVKTMGGFSFGAGVKLYKFNIGFGLTNYMKGNSAYQFSISTGLKEFKM